MKKITDLIFNQKNIFDEVVSNVKKRKINFWILILMLKDLILFGLEAIGFNIPYIYPVEMVVTTLIICFLAIIGTRHYWLDIIASSLNLVRVFISYMYSISIFPYALAYWFDYTIFISSALAITNYILIRYWLDKIGKRLLRKECDEECQDLGTKN